jgi:outer membrane protein OmpA-like peptidoglycan-associated protein
MTSIRVLALLSLSVSAAALLAGQALADDFDFNPSGWYGSLEGGYSKLASSKLYLNTAPTLPSDPNHKLRFSDGYGALGGLGYKFDNNFRVELELGYRRNDIPNINPYAGVNGHASGFSQMMNVIYDFDLAPNLLAYGGLGIGGVDVTVKASTNGISLLNGDDYTIGYQGVAGLAYRIAPLTYAYVDYHYLTAVGAHIGGGAFNQAPRVRFNDHLIGIGLRMYFNAPDVPPPAPAPRPVAAAPAPAPAPKPAVVAPAPRAFLVFFDFDRSEITPEARRIIDSAIGWARKSQVLKIAIAGHTDTMGSSDYNLALSMRRAEAVKAVIVASGYRDGDVSVTGKGFSQPLVSTGPQVKEPQNRRAEITLQ